MFMKNEFKAEVVRKGFTMDAVAKCMGIDVASLYRKVNGQSDFYRSEIDMLIDIFNLSDDDVLRIFFAPKVANFATRA